MKAVSGGLGWVCSSRLHFPSLSKVVTSVLSQKQAQCKLVKARIHSLRSSLNFQGRAQRG
jgi:hypothetical protein